MLKYYLAVANNLYQIIIKYKLQLVFKMEPPIAILFLCCFPRTNKNGVQRYAIEMINGVRSKGPKTYYLFWNKEDGILRSYIELLRNFIAVIRTVNVVHSMVLTPSSIPFLILARIYRKKILVTYHGNYLVEAPLRKRPLLFIPYWIADKISRNIADVIVSNTSSLLVEMKINRKNTQVIPHPFDLELLKDSTKKDIKKCSTDIVFASASNFDFKEKLTGLNLLIETMNEITKDVSDIKLMVFGHGSYLNEFKIKFASNRNILFMGFREDYRDFLNSADIYVHISGLDYGAYALIEALMQSKVVICNNLAGIMETIEPKNNYVVSLDPSSISRTIYSVIDEIRTNPTELRMKGIRNKEYATKRYSSEVILTDYLNLYSKLLYMNT
jgi:glycosyltransferase involved in cell wall biosynthesis